MKTSAILLLALLLHVAVAGENKWHATVSINFGGDTNLQQDAESYLKRNLRSLTDIDVTNDDNLAADYTFQILILTDHDTVNNLRGYISSMVITSGAPFNAVNIHDHLVFADSDLRSLCERLVNEADTQVFEPERQMPHYILSEKQASDTNFLKTHISWPATITITNSPSDLHPGPLTDADVGITNSISTTNAP